MKHKENRDEHRRINKIIICAILIVVIGCGSSLYLSAYEIDSTNYDICSSKIAQPIQIVQLTDLHNRTCLYHSHVSYAGQLAD